MRKNCTVKISCETQAVCDFITFALAECLSGGARLLRDQKERFICALYVDIRRGNTLVCAAHKKKTTRCLTTTLHPNKCRIKDVLSNDLIIRGHHGKLTDSTPPNRRVLIDKKFRTHGELHLDDCTTSTCVSAGVFFL
jgi:hypothetical protein